MANSDVNAIQVGGNHYKGAIQHWDFVAEYGLGYFEGQVTKYVTRWRKKNGLQDVQKARHFMDKLIELTVSKGYSKMPSASVAAAPSFTVAQYCEANELTSQESVIMVMMAQWAMSMSKAALLEGSLHLDALLEKAKAPTVIDLPEKARSALTDGEDDGGPGPSYVDQG